MNPIARLLELAADWTFLAHRDGLRCALPQIAAELAGLPARRLRFALLGFDLSMPLPEAHPAIELDIRPYTLAELAETARIHRPSEARLCRARLEGGDWGLAARYAGRLTGYAWASADPAAARERVPLRLLPGEVLCTDAYTAPEFRCQGVQSALTLARFQLLKTLGFKLALSYIQIHNYSSLAVWQKKLGSELIGEFTFIRFGPWIKIEGNGEFIDQRMHPVGWGTGKTGSKASA